MGRTSRRPGSSPLPHLTGNALHVLLAIAESETHAYGVLKRIRRNTNGRVALSASTLYSIIQRLERDRLIEPSDWRPDPALDDERRRYYRVTERGRRACNEELEHWENVVVRAKRLRGLKGART